MANTKQDEKDPKDVDVVGPPAEGEPEPEQPKASELKRADAISGPDVSDAEPNDPPVRTDRPDVPVVSVLTGDRACISCGFNLVGQQVTREPVYGMLLVRCPECNTAASLQEYPLLGKWASRWAACCSWASRCRRC